MPQMKAPVASLQLRNPSGPQATLYVEYSHARKLKRVATGVKVIISKWDAGTATIRKEGSRNPTADTTHVREVRDRVNQTLRDLSRRFDRAPTTEELTDALEAAAAPVAEVSPESELALTDVLEAFTNTPRLEWKSSGSIVMYRSLLSNLRQWIQETQKKRLITLKTLTLQDTQDFQEWLTKPRLERGKTIRSQDTTIQRRVKALRKFLACYTSELSFDYKQIQTVYRVLGESNYADVTLSPLELEQLENLELGQRLHTIRNLFLLQCWTALAYTDVMQLEKYKIRNGRIVLDRQKNDSKANCPLFPQAKKILEEYDYQIPQISNQAYNRYLKEVMQLLPSMLEEITVEVRIAEKKTKKTGPRWQFVGTHTPRRTFATNMMMQPQVTQKMVMLWGGWTDLRSFNRYLNAEAGEAAAVASIVASVA